MGNKYTVDDKIKQTSPYSYFCSYFMMVYAYLVLFPIFPNDRLRNEFFVSFIPTFSKTQTKVNVTFQIFKLPNLCTNNYMHLHGCIWIYRIWMKSLLAWKKRQNKLYEMPLEFHLIQKENQLSKIFQPWSCVQNFVKLIILSILITVCLP